LLGWLPKGQIRGVLGVGGLWPFSERGYGVYGGGRGLLLLLLLLR